MAVPDRRLTVPSKKPWEGSIPRGPWALDPCCMVGFQLGGSRFHLKALGRGLPAQTSYIALCLWYNFTLNIYIGRSRSRGADTNCLNMAGARLCFDFMNVDVIFLARSTAGQGAATLEVGCWTVHESNNRMCMGWGGSKRDAFQYKTLLISDPHALKSWAEQLQRTILEFSFQSWTIPIPLIAY